jgi:hypothetical protein
LTKNRPFMASYNIGRLSCNIFPLCPFMPTHCETPYAHINASG